MSWVRNAIKNIQSQDYEILHQTVFGGYGTKPNIFWALDPEDMPETLRLNVEETVKDDTSGMNTCAIVRLETLPAYNDEELQATGNPVACFSVHIGTKGSNVEFKRQINIYGDRNPMTPPDGRSPSHMWGEIEGNAVARRLKRMSVTMGWMDPPPMVRRKSSAAVVGGRSNRAASVVQQHMFHAAPYQQYRTEAATQRFTRKLSLRLGWMDSQMPVKESPQDQETALAAALARLEGLETAPTSPMKLPGLIPSSTASPTSPKMLEPISSGPFETAVQRMENVMSMRDKCVAFDEEVLEEHGADQFEVHNIYNDESPLVDPDNFPISSTDTNIPEPITLRETPMMNFQSGPSQVDPAQLRDTLAALEGKPSYQESSAPEIHEVIPRRLGRMSAKRASLFLEENTSEVGEPESIAADEAPQTAPKPRSRKASVVYALTLEEPTPVQPQRRQGKSVRSRKTMSMYAEPGTGYMVMGAARYMPEQRSFFNTDPPPIEFESTSRRLKRRSWNVVGRASKPIRASWMPAAKTIPDDVPFTQAERMMAAHAWNEPTPNYQRRLDANSAAHKSTKIFRHSMYPSVAESQCSPRQGYAPPVHWLEPITWPSHAIEPHGNINTSPLRSKRNSAYPEPHHIPAEVPENPLKWGMSPPVHVSPIVPSLLEEPAQEPATTAKARKKSNRLSRFVFLQAHNPGKGPVGASFDSGRPLDPHSLFQTPTRPSAPLQAIRMSRMKKIGSKLGSLFHS